MKSIDYAICAAQAAPAQAAAYAMTMDMIVTGTTSFDSCRHIVPQDTSLSIHERQKTRQKE